MSAQKKEIAHPSTSGDLLNDSIMTDATVILPDDGGPVNELTKLRVEKKLAGKDLIAVVQRLYPKYDKVIQSKVEHGDEYGICLRKDAMEALIRQFAPEWRPKRRRDLRSKPRRVQCRLTETVFNAMQKHMRDTGQNTQDFLEGIILKYLTERKEQ